jgi:hypothetical protein
MLLKIREGEEFWKKKRSQKIEWWALGFTIQILDCNGCWGRMDYYTTTWN